MIAITDSSVGLTRFYDFCVGKMEDMKTTEYRQPTDKELQGIENEVRDIMSSWYDEDDEKPTLH